MANGVVNASQVEAFAVGLGRVAALMQAALQAELVRAGTEAKVAVNSSHESPYDTGRLRRSVDLDAGPGDVSLWSSVVYSRIWQWGGTVTPNGHPITIPRTNYAGKEIEAAGDDIDERLGATLEGSWALL